MPANDRRREARESDEEREAKRKEKELYDFDARGDSFDDTTEFDDFASKENIVIDDESVSSEISTGDEEEGEAIEGDGVDSGGRDSDSRKGEKGRSSHPVRRPAEADLIKRHGLEVYCGAMGVTNVIAGGIAGGIYGTLAGLASGYAAGAHRLPGFGRFVAGSAGSSSAQFGGFLGAYTGSKCYLKHIRGKSDLANTFGAGFIAGAVVSLRSRRPYGLLLTGLEAAVTMTIIDAVFPSKI